jgi:sugar-phosphatase
VVEDSINGVIAAKAAKMLCVAVPEAEKQNDLRFAIADYKLQTMETFPAILREIGGTNNPNF